MSEFVTLYSIVQKIKQTEGKKLDSDELSAETSHYSRKFKEILNGLRIDPDLFKNSEGKYEIPIEAENEVIRMVNLFKSKEMKLVRNSQFDALSYKELKEIIDLTKVLLTYKLSGKSLLVHLNQLELLTQYSLKEAISEFEEESIQTLIDETKKVLERNFELTLNQQDKAALMKFYNQVVVQLHKEWEKIIEIVNDLRDTEVSEVTQEDVDEFECNNEDMKFKIHEAIVKEILKMKGGEQKKHLEELQRMVGLESSDQVLQELNQLSSEVETEKFKLVSDEDFDFGKKYKDIDELIIKAISIYRREREQNSFLSEFIDDLF